MTVILKITIDECSQSLSCVETDKGLSKDHENKFEICLLLSQT